MSVELFERRLAEALGDHAPGALDALRRDRHVAVWANPLSSGGRSAVEELASAGLQAASVPWLGEAATVPPEGRPILTRSEAVQSGRLYVQSLSSMLAPLVLAPTAGQQVLDLCAAPGGKTLHLAARMALQGALAAVEAVRPRFFKLQQTLERGGAGEFVRLYLADGRDVGRKTPGRFELVLLDAPCSSEARIDLREPEPLGFWSERKIAESARKQNALLRSAFDALAPGGRVLYCTCTFAPEENECVVAHLLRRLKGGAEIVPITLPIPNQSPGLTAWRGKALGESLRHTIRVLPTDTMSGFYLALLEKAG